MTEKDQCPTIRRATPTDAPDIAEVLMRSWESAYKNIIPMDFIIERNALRPEQLRQRITADNTTYYAIQLGEKIVGYMRIVDLPADDAADLEQIYLHPDHCRKGIGMRAMEFACGIARGYTN